MNDLRLKFKGLPVLVTGATGFIGLNLVKWLAGAKSQIHILARKGSDPKAISELKKIGKNSKSLTFHFAELTDLNSVKKAVEKARPVKVFHLAGKADTKQSRQTEKEFFDVNIFGTYALLKSLIGQPVDSFVFTSTDAVYGDNPSPFCESQRPAPCSLYGVSKFAAEEICQYFFRTYGAPIIILRLSMCYGPYQKRSRLISSIFTACREKQELILNSKEKIFNPLFVEDAVDAILRAAVTPKARGEVINIGGMEKISLKNLAQTISNLTGSQLKIHWSETPDKNINMDVSMDLGKAKRILNWKPKTSLRDGLIRLLQ